MSHSIVVRGPLYSYFEIMNTYLRKREGKENLAAYTHREEKCQKIIVKWKCAMAGAGFHLRSYNSHCEYRFYDYLCRIFVAIFGLCSAKAFPLHFPISPFSPHWNENYPKSFYSGISINIVPFLFLMPCIITLPKRNII